MSLPPFPDQNPPELTSGRGRARRAGHGVEPEAGAAVQPVRDQLQQPPADVSQGQRAGVAGRRAGGRGGGGESATACEKDCDGLRTNSLSGLQPTAPEPEERQEVPGKPGVFMRQRRVKPTRPKRSVVVVHEDIIGEAWWTEGRGKGLLSD